MTYMKGAAAKATELSWNAFPEPTPDSGSWQPDPHSVPVAGNLSDSRFNKNLFTERRKVALKRERRFGLANDDFTTTNTTSQNSESSTKTPTPAWARPLAHLLGDSTTKPASLGHPLPAQNQPTIMPSTSVPPHLRKQIKSHRPPAIKVGASKHQSDSLTAKSESMKATTVTKPASLPKSEQLTPQYNFGPVKRLTKAEVKSLNLGDDLKLQKTLLESFIPKSSNLSNQQHRRYLDTKLIILMEDEMDMQRRTTRQELYNMSDKELDKHLAKTTSMHKQTWEDEQKNTRHCEADTETVLAVHQQHKQCQFSQSKNRTTRPSEPAHSFFKPTFYP